MRNPHSVNVLYEPSYLLGVSVLQVEHGIGQLTLCPLDVSEDASETAQMANEQKLKEKVGGKGMLYVLYAQCTM